MKKLVVVMMILAASQAFAAQTIKGTAVAQGDAGAACRDISAPSHAEAEADADQQAANFCDTFSMSPKRVTEFKYSSSGCMTEGRGLAIHTSIYVYATAEYRCK